MLKRFKKIYNPINKLILPCLAFSMITGIFSALIITGFKILAEFAVHTSGTVYEAVRSNPIWLPLLVIGAAVIGLLASLILSISHSCKGGGIPTSVAAIRGIFSFKWIEGIVLLPVSALMTFFVGLPLGTEGPCVQMGTAVGNGVMKIFGKERHKGWRRYVMTGGASAGFSIATASPISAIIFAMEELHKHFSPVLLIVASVSVITAQITARALASVGIGDLEFFHLPRIDAIPPALYIAPIVVGIVTGICSILFTRLFYVVDKFMRVLLKKFSTRLVLPVLFAIVSIVGFFFAGSLSSGHSLVHSLFTPGTAWYILILLFLVRAIGMTVCNTSGATGGVFLPTLAFGAIIGALCADVMIAIGLMGSEHYLIVVVLGIVSFLGATSRIPLTACVFGIEALGGISNVLPIIISTTVSLLIVEASGLEDLTDAIIEAKIHKITKGKISTDVEVPLTVKKNSFAVGKELRDILWPNSCVVISFNRARYSKDHGAISEGDVITVRYITYDPEATARQLTDLVGEQSEETVKIMMP